MSIQAGTQERYYIVLGFCLFILIHFRRNIAPPQQVEDEAFSSGVMGPGIAIRPEMGKVFSALSIMQHFKS
ncbi:hypothetical protein BCV73_33685 [Paenibacillus sp. SSG-1]|nr:hypothetical protein BCV73_33685 [Paenibacillus sp. SSG-1]